MSSSLPTRHSLSYALFILLIAGVLAALSLLPWRNLMALPFFAFGLYWLARPDVDPPGRGRAFASVPAWSLTLVMGFFIAVHRPGGFDYPLVKNFGALYPGGEPFALHLNTAKTLGGYLIAVLLLQRQCTPALGVLPSLLLTAAAAALLLVAAATGFGVAVVPKLVDGIGYFLAVNLLATVVAEEMFFRVLIQQRVTILLQGSRLGPAVGAACATLLFALAHTTAMGPTFLLFFLAGAVYSGVYLLTGRISMAILVHWLTNAGHFLLLAYPLPK